MPTYAYACPKCGHEYDKLQKISDTTRAKCPECGARGERLIVGGAGLVFKGSGFYITDYKRAGEKKGDESGSDKRPAKSKDKSDSSPPSTDSSKTSGSAGEGTGKGAS